MSENKLFAIVIVIAIDDDDDIWLQSLELGM